MTAAAATTPRDPAAEVVRQHAGLVRRIAYHLAARLPASVEVDDLVQAGLLGLLSAAGSYRGDMGASFETFASIRIRGAMVDEIRRCDWAPRSVHRHAREAAETIRGIEQSTGRRALGAEVAAALGISLDDYHQRNADAARGPVMSMFGEDDGGPVAYVASDAADQPQARFEQDEFQDALARAVDALPLREKQVLALYYHEELNLREIGAVLGVSESRACQIHGQALVHLRAGLGQWREGAPPQAAALGLQWRAA
jgi:RNA polymerase sigma factor for flagellar operon FliA